MAKIKGVLFYISLFYLTVYIPLGLMIYFPHWYELNCHWHNRCEILGYDRSSKAIGELTEFFWHRGELVTRWTMKEKLHLTEVRGMFDKMFFGFVVSVALLFWTFDRKRVSRYAIANGVIIFSLILILPFFTRFWVEIFHPLLFDNDLWKNNPLDVSWYIMPRQFFKYSTLFLVIVCFLINFMLWFGFREKRRGGV
jgi:uncharacterized membrane protein